MTSDSIHDALRAAVLKKKALLAETNAVRLLNAAASGTANLVIESYGAHWVVYDYGCGLMDPLRAAAPEWRKEFGLESVTFLDRSIPGEEGRVDSAIAAGTFSDKAVVVMENSLRFLVEPQHPRNVGLFLDTRDLRKWLRANSAGTRVLNLFSYTCSLGISACSGGAEETVNVDISDRYLKWGRENLLLNDLPESRCRFLRMDSERYLDWAAKKNLTFDQIILDPPVFSRFEKKTFRFGDDYFRLVSKSVSLLSTRGILHAVTNFSGITVDEFKQQLQKTFAESGRKIEELRQLPLPMDFDMEAAEEREAGNAIIFQVTL